MFAVAEALQPDKGAIHSTTMVARELCIWHAGSCGISVKKKLLPDLCNSVCRNLSCNAGFVSMSLEMETVGWLLASDLSLRSL